MYIMEEDMFIELDVEVVMDMDMVEVAVAVVVVISDMSIMVTSNQAVEMEGAKLCGQ
jgi:hypothetical protein